MRPAGVIGVVLVICGLVILALRGLSYTKDRDAVKVGPLEVVTKEKGFIPPAAGMAAVLIGGVLIITSRRRV